MQRDSVIKNDSFAHVIREWRRMSGISQLELALRSGSSQKHISFLESGRSNPSRLMVFALSEAMDIPLRDRNELLLAAGFAPAYSERSLDDPEMSTVRSAIDRILLSNEPYPAFVFDRLHNVLAANEAAIKLQLFLYDVDCIDDLPTISGNTLHSLLHAEGMGRYIRNFDHVAAIMLCRLRAETMAAGHSEQACALMDELTKYKTIPENWNQQPDLDWCQPMLTVDIEKDDQCFSLFTTLTCLGAPFDITLQEIRIESYFPVDDSAAQFFAS